MIVLDTNVVSEVMRKEPTEAVLSWLSVQPQASLFTTTVTEAEIWYGIELIAAGRRRDGLVVAARGLFGEDLAGRLLPFDSAAARLFAIVAATRRRAGRPISQLDAQVAAIARSRGAAVATRNVDDFAACGVTVLNPWDGA